MSASPVTFWLTSTGRACAIDCARETVRWSKGIDYRMLIFESRPENEHGTVEAFKALDCDKRIWVGDYPPLGWVYNLFMRETGPFFIRLDDDCWPVCDPCEMVAEAIALLAAQPIPNHTISNVPLEMNPRLALDVTTGKSPDGANNVPEFLGYFNGGIFGPLAVVGHPGSLPVVAKRYILPWNETCHWRQVELYHILDGERRGLLSAYMLQWWGVMGHFSPMGVDGVSRQRNLNLYKAYRDRGYYGRRPPETWATAFFGTDLPDRRGAADGAG